MSEEKMLTVNDVPMILRREIEAAMIAPFIEAFAKEFGEEKTMAIVKEVIASLAKQAGQAMAKAIGDNSLEAFATKVTPNFSAGGALEVELKEATSECVRMDIVRCAYVDMYKKLGLEKLGPVLSCGRDVSLIEGFNEEAVFTREHTLMEGGPCCDFCLQKKTK